MNILKHHQLKIQKRIAIILALLLVSMGMFAGLPGANIPVVYAAPSTNLNFQGRLLNSAGNLVPDGLYNIEFKIYTLTAATDTTNLPKDFGACTYNTGTLDANCLWYERYYDTNGVTAGNDFRVNVVNGYFSVNLGSRIAFPSTINWDQQLYLMMNIGGTTQTATPTFDGEMTPRIQLTAVPLAFVANNVNSGDTSAASTNSANTVLQSGNTTGTTSNSGTVTLQSGNVTNGNSGNLIVDVGTASGTKGTISVGATSASAITVGHSGITTTNGGALAVSETLTANGSGTSLVVTNNTTIGGTTTVSNSILGNNAATGTTGTTSGSGGINVTSITLAAAGAFANGDVILVDNTGGSGQDYYTRITAGGGTTTLTVDPAVSYGTTAGYTGNATITKYTVQNVGAANTGTSFADSSRFFQGYFLGGIRTGSGSTVYSDQNISSSQALYLNTAGSTRLTVSSTGNTSIGNSNNTYKLDVTGEINASTGFRVNGTAGLASTTCSGGQVLQNQVVSGGITTGGTCVAAGIGTISGSGAANQVAYFTGGSVLSGSALFNYDGSRHGIGTATPSSLLDVAQPTTGVGTVSNAASGTTVTGVGTQFTNTFKIGDTITIGGQTVAISAIATDTSMTTAAITAANSSVSYTLTGGTRLSVKGNGNVGIGTTAPAGLLDVAGQTRTQSLFLKPSSGTATFQLQDGTPTTTSTISLSSSLFTIANNANPMVLNANTNGGVNTNQLYLATTSGVGIGTSSPDGLQVNAATTETADGSDNARLGIVSGTPRLILEDSGSTQWEVDNSAGSLRFFQPGSVKLTITSAGDATLAGNLTVSGTSIIGAGSNSTYGALTVQGAKGGWGGINFKNAAGTNLSTLMTDGTNTGFYNAATNGWNWYFSGSTLAVGTVPAANISAGTFGTGSYTVTGDITANNWIYAAGAVQGQYFRDSNNTGYYVDPDYISLVNQFNMLDARADVFYDRSNTGYYMQPRATSNINAMTMAGQLTVNSTIYQGAGGATLGPTNTYGMTVNGSIYYNGGIYLPGGSPAFGSGVCFGGGSAAPSFIGSITVYQMGSCSSLRKYKDNIVNLSYGMDTINALQPVQYNWKEDGRADTGFIAEDVEAINPIFASYQGSDLVGVNYDHMVALAIKGIQILDVQRVGMDIRLGAVEAGHFGGNITTVGDVYVGNDLTVHGYTTLQGLTVLGDTTVQKLTVNGKIVTGGAIPDAALGAAAGSGITALASVAGNDTAGTLSITAGNTGVMAGQVLGAVTFHTPYDHTPTITVTPTSEKAAAIRYFLLKTTTGWSIKVLDAPVAGETYSFDYHVIQ